MEHFKIRSEPYQRARMEDREGENRSEQFSILVQWSVHPMWFALVLITRGPRGGVLSGLHHPDVKCLENS